jgi:hypothetical protein
MSRMTVGHIAIHEFGDTFELYTDWTNLVSLPSPWLPLAGNLRTLQFAANGTRLVAGGSGTPAWGVTLSTVPAPALVRPPTAILTKMTVPAGGSPGFIGINCVVGTGAPSSGLQHQNVPGYDSTFPFYGQTTTGVVGFPADAVASIGALDGGGDPSTISLWAASTWHGGLQVAYAANEDGGYKVDIDPGTPGGVAAAPGSFTFEFTNTYWLEHTLLTFGTIATEDEVLEAWRTLMGFPF